MSVVNAPSSSASAACSNLVIRFSVGGKEAYAPSIRTPKGTLMWGRNAGGRNVWAFSSEKAENLRHKVVEYTRLDWGEFRDSGGNVAAPIGEAKAAPKAAPVKPAPVKAAPATPAEPGHRSAAQCRATLTLCVKNLARCERGAIGGDVEKYARAERTAYISYAEALQREGLSVEAAETESARVGREARDAVLLAA